MSINKKALTRYLAYDKCLRNTGAKYTWQRLLDEANKALFEEGLEGIGKTQFYADMKFMELSEWKAPIEKYKDGRTVYIKYSNSGYSINNQPLNETEAKQLKSALQVLSRFKGIPQFEFINEIIPVIESKLGLVSLEREIMSFESNLDYEGAKFITPLFNAIVNKRALTIDYQDFKSHLPYTIVFHPYYLKQYNNRWFVFGYNEFTQNEYWNMALDRIKTIEEAKIKYIETEIEWDDYFYDLIGVTKKVDEELQTIKLWFSPIQAPYVITKPIHPSQIKIKYNEEGLEISIKVIPNYELEKLILSFGETVKVLSPESFQKVITSRIYNSAGLY
jgi:predicted DNA-binding transcriptional regulator YafY